MVTILPARNRRFSIDQQGLFMRSLAWETFLLYQTHWCFQWYTYSVSSWSTIPYLIFAYCFQTTITDRIYHMDYAERHMWVMVCLHSYEHLRVSIGFDRICVAQCLISCTVFCFLLVFFFLAMALSMCFRFISLIVHLLSLVYFLYVCCNHKLILSLLSEMISTFFRDEKIEFWECLEKRKYQVVCINCKITP